MHKGRLPEKPIRPITANDLLDTKKHTNVLFDII